MNVEPVRSAKARVWALERVGPPRWVGNCLHDIFYLLWFNMNSHSVSPDHHARSPLASYGLARVSRPRAAAPPALALRAASGYAFSHSPYPITYY